MLGMGDIYKLEKPTLNTNFGKTTIVDISLGEKHCCALDYYNDIYIWGLGSKGELGQATVRKSLIPTKISLGYKVISAKCGFTYSAFVDVNHRFLFIGSIVEKKKFLADLPENFCEVQPNFSVTLIEDLVVQFMDCGTNFIAVIDTKGSLYFYNENEKLCKYQSKLCFTKIKCLNNSVYANANHSDKHFLFEIRSNNKFSAFTDLEETFYQINLDNSDMSLINTPYYQELLFFSVKTQHPDDIMKLNARKAIIKPCSVYNSECGINNEQIHIENNSSCPNNQLKDTLYVFPPNSKRKLNNDKDNVTPDKYNSNNNFERINKISNLLGKILIGKIEKIENNYGMKTRNKTDRNVYSRRASIEKINSLNFKTSPVRNIHNQFDHLKSDKNEISQNERNSIFDIKENIMIKKSDRTIPNRPPRKERNSHRSNQGLNQEFLTSLQSQKTEENNFETFKNLNNLIEKANIDSNHKNFTFKKKTFNENSINSNKSKDEMEVRPRRIETQRNEKRENLSNTGSSFLSKKFDDKKLKICSSRDNSINYAKEDLVNRDNSNSQKRYKKKSLSVCRSSKDEILITGKITNLKIEKQEEYKSTNNQTVCSPIYVKPILNRNFRVHRNKKVSQDNNEDRGSELVTQDKKEQNAKNIETINIAPEKKEELGNSQQKTVTKPNNKRSSIMVPNTKIITNQFIDLPPFVIGSEDLDSTIKKNDSNIDIRPQTAKDSQKGLTKRRYENTSNRDKNSQTDHSIEFDIDLLEGKHAEITKKDKTEKIIDEGGIRDPIIKNIESFKLKNVKEKIDSFHSRKELRASITLSPNCIKPTKIENDQLMRVSKYEPIELDNTLKSISVTQSNQLGKLNGMKNNLMNSSSKFSRPSSRQNTEGNMKTEPNSFNVTSFLNYSLQKKKQSSTLTTSIRSNSRNKEGNNYNFKLDSMKEAIDPKKNQLTLKNSTRDTTRDSNKFSSFRSNSCKKELQPKQNQTLRPQNSLNSYMLNFLK